MTVELTEFLLARIAEDEEVAKEALSFSSLYDQESLTWHWIAAHADGSRLTPTNHSPLRVLAECEAKRRIVDEHLGHRGDCDRDYQYGSGPCSTLLTLASVYADHPDYREEWRP